VALAETAGTAAVAFAATNVDDVVILAVLFARTDAAFRVRHIVLGQTLGFAVLVVAGLAAGAGLLALPEEAVGLIGIVPIALGIHAFLEARRGDDDDDDETPVAALGTLGVASITIASGADNVAVYAPLFATAGFDGFATTVVVFAVLLAALLAVGRVIGSRPAVVRAVHRAGDYAVPVVLIALGVFIVLESGLL
jgi:cadmium resistance protein CadD (predicted permease)